MPKISSFILGIIVMSLIASIFGLFVNEMVTNYDSPEEQQSLINYNRLDNISELTQDIRNDTEITERAGLLDVIGGYFSGAYNALKTTGQSIDTFSDMTQQATEDANLGEVGQILRTALITSVFVLIFIGIFISAIMKWEL